MLMDPLQSLERPVRLAPARLSRRRRVLQLMLAGSLLLHLLGLVALWWTRPEPPPDDLNDNSDQVAMVFESPGAAQASQQSPSATKASSAPTGNENATTTQPNPDTSPPLPPPQATQPTPPQPEPPAPAPPAAPAPPVPPQAAEAPSPAQTLPTPPSPQPPATVTLSQEAPELPPPPLMPETPPALPSLTFSVPQRPAPPSPPRRYARPSTQNPFGNPQDWSLNSAPSPQPPGRSSRGFDLSTGELSGQKDATVGYVAGAHPSGDWLGALRRWATARLYYPEQAIADHQQGTSVLLLTIARSGQVTGVRLLQSARSPFLDGAWIDIFRGSTVPAFTPDMAEASTQVTYTLHYRLVSH